MGDDAVHFTVFGSGLNMLPTTSLPIMPLLTTWYYYEGMCLGKDSSPPDIPPHSTLVFEVDCKSVK